jgi:hypothetical protein
MAKATDVLRQVGLVAEDFKTSNLWSHKATDGGANCNTEIRFKGKKESSWYLEDHGYESDKVSHAWTNIYAV